MNISDFFLGNKENNSMNLRRLSNASSHDSLRKTQRYRTHSFLSKDVIVRKGNNDSWDNRTSMKSTGRIDNNFSGKGVMKNKYVKFSSETNHII